MRPRAQTLGGPAGLINELRSVPAPCASRGKTRRAWARSGVAATGRGPPPPKQAQGVGIEGRRNARTVGGAVLAGVQTRNKMAAAAVLGHCYRHWRPSILHGSESMHARTHGIHLLNLLERARRDMFQAPIGTFSATGCLYRPWPANSAQPEKCTRTGPASEDLQVEVLGGIPWQLARMQEGGLCFARNHGSWAEEFDWLKACAH